MNTRRGWFLVIGLMIGLLLGGGAYFLLPARKIISVAPNSPIVVLKAPVLVPSFEGGSTVPTADTASSPQPQVGLVPTPAYEYNARGQLQRITYRDGSTYSYLYDAYGDKIKETSRTGKTWCYLYDQAHRLIAVMDPEGRITHKEASPSTSNAN
jgi:YD repeat-containing protein